jgi:hypothetical protein
MVDRLTDWCLDHPKIVVMFAAIMVAESVYSFHRIVTWAESVEQIEASEFFGG